MVLTASNAYVKYGYEAVYGGGTVGSSIFGKDQHIAGLTWMTNQQEITQLYTPEIQDYVYGKDEGKCSVNYTLSNPWAFTSILNSPLADDTDTDPDTDGNQDVTDHYWTSNPRVNPNIRGSPKTLNLQFGYAAEDSHVVRNAKGAVTTSLNLKTAVNDKISVSQNMVWANEDDITTTLSAPAHNVDSEFIPYMFHHASLTVGNSVVAQVQDLDITFDIGSEQWYGLGSESGVDAYRKLIKINGKFTVAMVNAAMLQRVIDRSVNADMSISITNGMGGVDERSITIECQTVGFGEHSYDFEPGEPVIEDIPFMVGRVNVTAANNQSHPDDRS